MNCPKCGAEIAEGMAFCPYCGFNLAGTGTQGFQQGQNPQYQQTSNTQQHNPANQQQQSYPGTGTNQQTPAPYGPTYNIYQPPPKESSAGKIIVGIVVAILLIILLLALFLPSTTSYSGVPLPTTGNLNVKYNSVWGNDVDVYLDGEYLGQIPSDEYYTFHGISPGTHTVEIRSTGGSFLADKTVTINAGETTTVELSYGD